MFINSTFKTVYDLNPAWLHAEDAAKRNAMYRRKWTAEQRELAHRFAACCEDVFPRSKVYINWRKKFMAVKVERPETAALLTDEAQLLGDSVRAMGWAVKVTKNGIIFRIA